MVARVTYFISSVNINIDISLIDVYALIYREQIAVFSLDDLAAAPSPAPQNCIGAGREAFAMDKKTAARPVLEKSTKHNLSIKSSNSDILLRGGKLCVTLLTKHRSRVAPSVEMDRDEQSSNSDCSQIA